jgi:hypothetical protein
MKSAFNFKYQLWRDWSFNNIKFHSIVVKPRLYTKITRKKLYFPKFKIQWMSVYILKIYLLTNWQICYRCFSIMHLRLHLFHRKRRNVFVKFKKYKRHAMPSKIKGYDFQCVFFMCVHRTFKSETAQKCV